jgi:hypothetical protein
MLKRIGAVFKKYSPIGMRGFVEEKAMLNLAQAIKCLLSRKAASLPGRPFLPV